MNFQAYLENTYRIIKAEPIILILGGLVVQLLTILTMGILAGPFMGGYFLLIIYYIRENRKPTFNDIFSGLQQFANLLPTAFISWLSNRSLWFLDLWTGLSCRQLLPLGCPLLWNRCIGRMVRCLLYDRNCGFRLVVCLGGIHSMCT